MLCLLAVSMLDGPRLLPRGCCVESSQSKIRAKPFSSGSRLWNALSYIPNLPSAHHVTNRLSTSPSAQDFTRCRRCGPASGLMLKLRRKRRDADKKPDAGGVRETLTLVRE